MNNGEMMRWSVMAGIGIVFILDFLFYISTFEGLTIFFICFGLGILADFIIAINKDRKKGARRR